MKLGKLLALSAVAAMALVGCGGDESASSANKISADMYTEVGTYPILKDGATVSFTAFAPLRPGVTTYDSEVNHFSKYMEEMTGVHIDFMEATQADAKQKFNIMMTGGDYTDVILSMATGVSELQLYGQQGIFLPLNDLIDQHAPNIKKALEDHPEVMEAWTAEDGNLYTIPKMGGATHSLTSYRMWLNYEWLDNLDLEVPKTTEEFYQVLKAFKEQDANGNGDPNDEVPLSGSIDAWNGDPMPFLLNAFIPASPSSQYINIAEDGSLYYVKATDEYREYLKYMHKLYDEGLIDSMMFSQTKDQLLKLGSNPEIAIMGATAGGSISVIANTADTDRWTQYQALPPLTGPEGVRSAAHTVDYGASRLSITNKCANPEAVLRYFDYMFTPEGRMYNIFGVVGENSRVVPAEEGLLNLIGEPAIYTRKPADSAKDLAWNNMGPTYSWPGYELEFSVMENTKNDAEYVLYNSAVNDYLPVAQDPATMLPPLAFTTDESRAIVDIITNLNLYIDQVTSEFITGIKDPNDDKEWDEYLEMLEKNRLSEYLAVNQASLDRKRAK
ncbi:extracellular solute-binding protein [Candidatus Epulonipiscium viviparus]|uniref:extracellular solute-binding protein n=1 Tax=Candidatus Epulonipiscium viviparus TaxID=420336 RepID=UPI002738040E|nr:extracellular solute-binding protein [Candidatus Epulopiscium viviparus]